MDDSATTLIRGFRKLVENVRWRCEDFDAYALARALSLSHRAHFSGEQLESVASADDNRSRFQLFFDEWAKYDQQPHRTIWMVRNSAVRLGMTNLTGVIDDGVIEFLAIEPMTDEAVIFAKSAFLIEYTYRLEKAGYQKSAENIINQVKENNNLGELLRRFDQVKL